MNETDRKRLMLYLLLAPLPHMGGEREEGSEPEERPATVFRSRRSDRTQILVQRWEDLTPGGEWTGQLTRLRFRVEKIAICRVAGHAVAAMEVRSRGSWRPNGGVEIPALEADLTACARTFLSAHTKPGTIPWVGRFALLEKRDSAPENWLADQYEQVEIEVVTRWSFRDGVVVRLGWGNGAISNWHILDTDVRQDIVRGLVDAQSVWAEVDDLSRRSHDLIAKFVVKDAKVTSRELRHEQREAEGLSVRLANHHLAYDDLVMNVQGARREVALGALRSWTYHEATQRVSRRIDDLHRVMNARVERFSRRYQVAVESILFLLGVLAVVDLGLAAVGTAYSGAVGSAPGVGSNLGFFDWLRSVNADTMVLGTFLIAIALLVYAEARRRR